MIPPGLALIIWIPCVAMMFSSLRPMRAVALAYLIGWLLLPVYEINIKGFWDIDKVIATNFGVMAGIFLFCPQAVRQYRFHPADALLVLYCFASFIASIDNDLGLHDGVSRFCQEFFFFGAPYVAGRLFIRRREDITDVARLIVVASAVYAMLAVWEWKMSPKIATTIYDVEFVHSWAQHRRWGFFRPILFFSHALGLGVFFAWTSFLGVWLYRAGELRRAIAVPPWVIALAPMILLPASLRLGVEIAVVAGALCVCWIGLILYTAFSTPHAVKSIMLPCWAMIAASIGGLAALLLVGPGTIFVLGCGMLWFGDLMRTRFVPLLPVLFAVFWMGARYTNTTDGQWLISLVASFSDRDKSLTYRIDAETVTIEHSRERALFGWGTWGRNRVYDESGNKEVSLDGLWLNTVSATGLFGLTMFFLWWCWPLLIAVDVHRYIRGDPAIEAVLVAISLQAMNFLFNDFLDPMLTLMSGFLITALAATRFRAKNPPIMAIMPSQESSPRPATREPVAPIR